MKRMAYNLASPIGIAEPVDLNDFQGWFAKELAQVPSLAEKRVLEIVANELDAFVRWAPRALLLWSGSDRTRPPDGKQRYFSYPAHIRALAKERRLTLDGRPNGPAIASFILAGGERPVRFGSSNRWSIHHLYSGKFPYCGRTDTTHAAKHELHFTQSAGLVAVHPIADAIVDEFPFFAWLLRGHAYRRFGYDPDGVFSHQRDEYGFASGQLCYVVPS